MSYRTSLQRVNPAEGKIRVRGAGSDLGNSLTGWWLAFPPWSPGLLSARLHSHVMASKKATVENGKLNAVGGFESAT
jgi:hypothetical protein